MVEVVTFALVICALAAVTPVVKFNVADVIFVDATLVFSSVAMVEVVTFALVICALAVVTPVVKFNVADVILVDTIFVIVLLVAYTAPVVIFVEAVNPYKVTYAFGALNAPGTNKFAKVLVPETAKAVKLLKPLTFIVPALRFVSTKFVDVIFTVVNVPPTNKLPDKLKLPPVIVVPTNVLALTVVPIILLAETFVIVVLVNVVNPVALIVPVVNPVVATSTPTVPLVATTFVKVLNPVALIVPVVIDVAAIFVAVILVAYTAPVVKLVVILAVPLTSRVALGDAVLIPTLAVET